MNPKYENLHYIDLGASLRKFNDVIKSRKQGDMGEVTNAIACIHLASNQNVQNTS